MPFQPPHPLVLITDGGRPYEDLLRRVTRLVAAGVRWVQIREPQRPTHELLELSRAIADDLHAVGGKLSINDRIDVALASRADGVHLGWRSMPIPTVREILGPDRWIGFSAHSADEARKAFSEGADYVTYGPIYDTPSKRGILAPTGAQALREIVAADHGPVFAVGGIDSARAPEVMATGAGGVCVISFLMSAEAPEEATQAILAAIGDR